MPDVEIMKQSEFLYYQSNERGTRIMLGEGSYYQFSQESEKPWLLQVRINEKDEEGVLHPIEKEWEKIRKLEKTRHFEKGWISYVPSPEEVRQREKIKRQLEACDQLKEDLQNELLVLPLDTMPYDKLVALADRIGASLTDKNGKQYSEKGLRNSIAGKLGLQLSMEIEPPNKSIEEVGSESIFASMANIEPEPTLKPKTVKKRGK